ncbi:MAG: HAMP domain-containing histidine kinase [Armatimonadetes bacterium]|jgi:signal transduction histidine kinase|nr:HAMP domain-containing histidine kinase [Armatimonadota bacterium]MDI9601518.1 HAMP domain-containing sensor histidine kinase [Acidobacteriota bacterium]NLN89773.1 HAMP domain-containing histidine kinase [candidate division WS1 bacterium]
MFDRDTLEYITAGTYWSLVLCWCAILIFYVKEYSWLRKTNRLVATLIIVIFIDGARTLVESVYFGIWYTASAELFPYAWKSVLEQPEHVLIPKLLNFLAALVIISVLVRRWFRDADQEAQRQQELTQSHEELKRLEKLRDDLVHMIVHDMRTPITSIMGSLQTALAEDQGSEVRDEMVQNAIDDAQRLEGMMADLLDVNRLETGKLELSIGPAVVREILEEAGRMVAFAAAEKDVRLIVEDTTPGLAVRADRRILLRILGNLAQNAIRHTPDGGTVTLSATGRQDAVEFRVADTGEGIPERILPRVFDKFFHASASEAKQLRSIGLGLAFCRLATEAHGGTIRVESTEGEGSVFSFTIPHRPAEH